MFLPRLRSIRGNGQQTLGSCSLCPCLPGGWKITTDHCGSQSKWIVAQVVPSTSTSTTIVVLQSVFATHGIPEQLVSDNATGFACEEFRRFNNCNGIHRTFTSPYHPAANG